jgi:hypothetical protein
MFGACGYAPMMQLGDFTKNLTEKIDQLIKIAKRKNTTINNMSQKILLDKINIPGIKTYEVYRQGGYASVEKP